MTTRSRCSVALVVVVVALAALVALARGAPPPDGFFSRVATVSTWRVDDAPLPSSCAWHELPRPTFSLLNALDVCRPSPTLAVRKSLVADADGDDASLRTDMWLPGGGGSDGANCDGTPSVTSYASLDTCEHVVPTLVTRAERGLPSTAAAARLTYRDARACINADSDWQLSLSSSVVAGVPQWLDECVTYTTTTTTTTAAAAAAAATATTRDSDELRAWSIAAAHDALEHDDAAVAVAAARPHAHAKRTTVAERRLSASSQRLVRTDGRFVRMLYAAAACDAAAHVGNMTFVPCECGPIEWTHRAQRFVPSDGAC